LRVLCIRKKNVIALQALRNIERRHVGNAQARIDREEDKILHVSAAPAAMTRPRRNRQKRIAGGIDALHLRIREGCFVGGDGRPFRRFQVFRNILGQPFALHAKAHEGFQALQFFGFGADTVLPGCIEAVHIGDGELADKQVTARVAMRAELLNEGAVLIEGCGLDATIAALGEVGFARIRDAHAAARGCGRRGWLRECK